MKDRIMEFNIIKETLTVKQREAVNIFLPSIFLSLPRFVADAAPRGAGLVTLSILLANKKKFIRRASPFGFSRRKNFCTDFIHMKCDNQNR